MFPRESPTSSTFIPVIEQINCKLKVKMEVYAFALSMFSKNLLAGNQLVFEDLNVI